MRVRTHIVRFIRISLTILWISATIGDQASAAEWPQFRGPNGDGVAAISSHPAEWSEEQNIDWKIELPGVAWSQPIIWSDRIYVTTAIADDQPRPRTGESGPGFSFFSAEGFSRTLTGGKPPETVHRWMLICLDLDSGERLWETTVRESPPTIPRHRSNSYASETPVTDGEFIYVCVAMAGLYCFDRDGNEIWNQPLSSHSMQYGWGTGSSPLLVNELLYVLCDNEDASYVAAFDKSNGSERWRTERVEQSNWSTPYLWNNNKRAELVTCGGAKIRSYDPGNGNLLWELPGNGRCAMTAVGKPDLLFVGSATRSTGASGTLTAVRPGAVGDLTAEDAKHSVAWSLPQAAPNLSSPLLFDGCVYALSQFGGIIQCFDAETGKRHYRKRLPGAAGFTASPWAAGGKVFCLDEKGQTFVLVPGAEYQVVRTNELEGMFWSSAAIADDALLLRSVDHLYRISESGHPSRP